MYLFASRLVTTESEGYRVKITNVCTGTLICKYGTVQSFGMALDFNAAPRDDHLNSPKGVAVTPDSSFVIVCDSQNDRVQMLRLVVDGNTANLEFVRSIGSSPPNSSDQSKLREGYLVRPTFVALLPGAAGGQQTMLITDTSNKGVSQFELDGTFIRIFAGKKDDEKDGGGGGSGSRPSSGQLDFPKGITVLASSGEVAIISVGCTVQIFDREGNYKRQFGSYGTEDGQFSTLSTIGHGGLASDACGNILIVDYGSHRLQVFNAQGTHLCTRSDFGIGMDEYDQVTKAIAWSTGGRLALATCGVEIGMGANNPGVVRVWYQTGSE